MAGDGECARCCLRFVVTSGLSALFLWLTLRTYKPSLFIQDLSVSVNNHTNTIFYKLTLRNQMKDKGVSYANITLTFLYNSTLPIANHTLPAFYQGHGKTAHRNHAVQASMPWPTNGTLPFFRVRAATRIKSKIMLWFTKSHALVVAADVALDASGRKLNNKSIKFKSAATDFGTPRLRLPLVALFTFFFILFFF